MGVEALPEAQARFEPEALICGLARLRPIADRLGRSRRSVEGRAFEVRVAELDGHLARLLSVRLGECQLVRSRVAHALRPEREEGVRGHETGDRVPVLGQLEQPATACA